MAKCKNCKNYGSVFNEDNEVVYKWCPKKNDNPDEELERECEHYEPLTNADRIRNMTDEELAELLCLYDVCVTCSHDGRTCNTMNCDNIGLKKNGYKARWNK